MHGGDPPANITQKRPNQGRAGMQAFMASQSLSGPVYSISGGWTLQKSTIGLGAVDCGAITLPFGLCYDAQHKTKMWCHCHLWLQPKQCRPLCFPPCTEH